MNSLQPRVHSPVCPGATRIFAANERMNQLVLEHLDPAAWRAKPPGNVRTIAAIFTHMHNVRAKWIRLSAPHLKVPPQVNRARCTLAEARAALAESADRCEKMLGENGAREFVRDGWAQPWPVGPEMMSYMVCHEAHHRGQVCMLAHQLGFPLPKAVASKLWNWETLWRDSGPLLQRQL